MGAASSVPVGEDEKAVSPSSTPEWVSEMARTLEPRFPDVELYWEADASDGNLHGGDSVLRVLHGAGAFTSPRLLLDSAVRACHLVCRTGSGVCGHPGVTHGGFTALLIDELAGQAYSAFVQPQHGAGVTANLSIDYVRKLPADRYVRFTAVVRRTDGRKVWLEVEVADAAPLPSSAAANDCQSPVASDGGADVNVAEDGGGGAVYATGTALFIILAKD